VKTPPRCAAGARDQDARRRGAGGSAHGGRTGRSECGVRLAPAPPPPRSHSRGESGGVMGGEHTAATAQSAAPDRLNDGGVAERVPANEMYPTYMAL
jgi:hypothetical protein